MTEQDRNRLRMKQDFLLMLAVDMAKSDESLRIDEKKSAPTLTSLRTEIHPGWEPVIDSLIRTLAASHSPVVGIPDFNHLSR